MLPWLSFAFAQAPSHDALLQLERVHCRADGDIVWARTGRAGHWALTVAGQHVTAAQPGVIALTRRVVEPASRVDREGAPWRWTEQITVRTISGEPLRSGPAVVDARFRCTDLSDPKSIWVDVGSLTSPGTNFGLPGPGELRCRSDDPDVYWNTWRKSGGARPYPGQEVGGSILAVDELLVDRSVVREGELFPVDPNAPADRLVPEVLERTLLRAADPKLSRSQQVIRFTRADGSPLVAGMAQLEVALTCESYQYPPIP